MRAWNVIISLTSYIGFFLILVRNSNNLEFLSKNTKTYMINQIAYMPQFRTSNLFIFIKFFFNFNSSTVNTSVILMPGVGGWIFYYLLTALLASIRRGGSVYIKIQWQEMEILWDKVKILILLFLCSFVYHIQNLWPYNLESLTISYFVPSPHPPST